ncbi:hypothetical protein CANCADRAFT_4551 [Tortispora caseinolytica NRRL Y-17796]|uniref:Uncharacterized protein n=1 Tax=Tortispora caseinolytica NRRL Y-17796 TaxID=767744 RepID=A0A1E4T9J6_9ASCO|nr:hypothetical protein CANCADRAFT_4551 [Tortispora caseinolytica NRRL Y-17796]
MSGVLYNEADTKLAEKVLRRAEISRITRQLKTRLALASFKTKRGWEDLSLESIEPKIYAESSKQSLKEGQAVFPRSTRNNARKRMRTLSEVAEPTFAIPELIDRTNLSSPLRRIDWGDNSMIMEPMHHHEPQTPHTPRKTNQEDEGADLLLYLATSPSPASRSRFDVTQTPDSISRRLKFSNTSDPMSSLSGSASSLKVPSTPSHFNISEFVNMCTPSPAQGTWTGGNTLDTPSKRFRTPGKDQ